MKFQGLFSSIIAILLGLMFGLVIMIIANPSTALPGFVTMIGGWLTNDFLRRFGDLIFLAGPLILTGLSVGFAFKTGLFNIGATGQYTMGMFAGVFVGVHGDFLGPLQWVGAFIAAMIFGGLWGLIPGLLKAYFNVHEVIASIMLNYIGMHTVNVLIQGDESLFNVAFSKTRPIDLNAYIPTTFLRDIFERSSIDFGIILALGFSLLIYFILYKTKFGFELQAVGSNRFAAKYSGIKENRSVILSMVVAGALAGAAGALYFLGKGSINSGNQYSVGNELMSAGFDGIAVALLGQSHPFGIVLSAFFISFIQRGGYFMQLLGIKVEIIDVIIAAIIYTSAMAMLVKDSVMKWLNVGGKKK
jgi:simple sugar transport system permease protein